MSEGVTSGPPRHPDSQLVSGELRNHARKLWGRLTTAAHATPCHGPVDLPITQQLPTCWRAPTLFASLLSQVLPTYEAVAAQSE